MDGSVHTHTHTHTLWQGLEEKGNVYWSRRLSSRRWENSFSNPSSGSLEFRCQMQYFKLNYYKTKMEREKRADFLKSLRDSTWRYLDICNRLARVSYNLARHMQFRGALYYLTESRKQGHTNLRLPQHWLWKSAEWLLDCRLRLLANPIWLRATFLFACGPHTKR